MLGSALMETAALTPHTDRMGQLCGKQHKQTERGGVIRGSGTKKGMYTTTALLSHCQRQEVGSGALAASFIGILQHKWEGRVA